MAGSCSAISCTSLGSPFSQFAVFCLCALCLCALCVCALRLCAPCLFTCEQVVEDLAAPPTMPLGANVLYTALLRAGESKLQLQYLTLDLVSVIDREWELGQLVSAAQGCEVVLIIAVGWLCSSLTR